MMMVNESATETECLDRKSDSLSVVEHSVLAETERVISADRHIL